MVRPVKSLPDQGPLLVSSLVNKSGRCWHQEFIGMWERHTECVCEKKKRGAELCERNLHVMTITKAVKSHSAHTHWVFIRVQEVNVGVRLCHNCLSFHSVSKRITHGPLPAGWSLYSWKCLFLTAAEMDETCVPTLFRYGKTQKCKNTLCLWKYNEPTWNASSTNGKHLHSTAARPLVIATAFFVLVILRHLRLKQRDTAPTSLRRSVTVKGHRRENIKIMHFTNSVKRLACGCQWQQSKRVFKEKWKSAYYWLYQASLFELPHLLRLPWQSAECVRAMKQTEKWEWKEGMAGKKQVIKRYKGESRWCGSSSVRLNGRGGRVGL